MRIGVRGYLKLLIPEGANEHVARKRTAACSREAVSDVLEMFTFKRPKFQPKIKPCEENSIQNRFSEENVSAAK